MVWKLWLFLRDYFGKKRSHRTCSILLRRGTIKFRELYRALLTTIEPFSPMDYSNLIPKINHQKIHFLWSEFWRSCAWVCTIPIFFNQYRNAKANQGCWFCGDCWLEKRLTQSLKDILPPGLKKYPFWGGSSLPRLENVQGGYRNYNRSIALFGTIISLITI